MGTARRWAQWVVGAFLGVGLGARTLHAQASAVISGGVERLAASARKPATEPLQLAVSSGGSPLSAASVALVLQSSTNMWVLRHRSASTDSVGRVRIDGIEVLQPRSVLASDTILIARVRVNGVLLDSPSVPIDVSAPESLSLDVVSPAETQIQIGAPFGMRVRVTAASAAGATVARNALIRVILPSGLQQVAATNDVGEVNFESLVLRNVKPGEVSLRFELEGRAKSPISWVAQARTGPPYRLQIERSLAPAYAVGRPFPLVVKLFDEAGNPVTANVLIQLRAADGLLSGGKDEPRMPYLERTTNEEGEARFMTTSLFASQGKTQLVASAGPAKDSIEIEVLNGVPHRMIVLQEPPSVIIPDTVFSDTASVLVQDIAGNPLSGVAVRVSLIRESKSSGKRDKQSSARPIQLRGVRNRRTGADGIATFPGLSFVGPGDSSYQLHFLLADNVSKEVAATSNQMAYSPIDAYDRNFVIVSGIKSVSGVIPAQEFFDIRFRFRFSPRVHVLLHSDVGLQRKSTSDTVEVKSSQERLVDAGVWFNFTHQGWVMSDPLTDAPERYAYAGAHVRVFATVPYLGLHLGSVELAKSKFYGSTANLGVAMPTERIPVRVDGVVISPSRVNLSFDAFLRSDGIDFFKFLNIKGTLLIPIGERGRRPISRIVIAVPIGGLVQF